MNKIVIFGAGNIGRSFIGSIFASNGYDTVFIDANRELVEALNRRGCYPIIIKRNSKPDERIEVNGIRAVHSSESQQVLEELADCNLCSTSVGQAALKFIIPFIAEAAALRIKQGRRPLDVIIAENIRNGADYFRGVFREQGLKGDEAGLIETSIGKMVPIMGKEDLAEDPLVLHAEEYNTLILDGSGFKNASPLLPEIKTVTNIAAWVDRKLFIHNMGHAATAYFGYATNPEQKMIADAIIEVGVRDRVYSAMHQAAAALLKEYPEDFTAKALTEHIDDLLYRFGNRALGDTIFRVGRDLSRKLHRDDRVLGAAALCIKHSLPFDRIIDIFNAGLRFRAADEKGDMFAGDSGFHRELESGGIANLLEIKLGLADSDKELKRYILNQIQFRQ